MAWKAILQLALCRLREFYREPVALFWVYGFPLTVLLALGFGFTDRPAATLTLAISQENLSPEQLLQLQSILDDEPGLLTRVCSLAEAQSALAQVKISAVLEVERPAPPYSYTIHYDSDRPDSVHACAVVEAVLLRTARDAPRVTTLATTRQGSRYIDFLVPGLLAVGVMGGSLVSVGYTLVEMRLRKTLKVFLATPLRRRDLFAGLMTARLIFLIPEVLLVLLVGHVVFAVPLPGAPLGLLFVLLLGAFAFMALGLLLGARGRALEAISGWVSVLMLVQWTFSGVFFAREVYPVAWQPWLRALPLTALVDATRGMMQPQPSNVLSELGVLLGWTLAGFLLALWRFRP